jgi:hypothetical protein
MLFSPTTFVGIDPTAGQKPVVYAALDDDLRLLALGRGGMDEVLAFMAGQRQAVAAVCAPRQPNQSLMAQEEVRRQLSPRPRPGRWVNFRVADYLLRQHNIISPQTNAEAEKNPNWMQMGFTLHRRLERLGYSPYPATGSSHQCLEVYPHASFTVLLGRTPFPKYTLEGRLQRQLVLHDRELKIPDPMLVFEEITRHRLLHGILPLDTVYSPSELDALVAAYTAWLAVIHPEQTCTLGAAEEGQIVLPAAELTERY